ncbi:AAC(3) family N-acetyltransferase [Geomonas paludis]|uniref:Aminoglycoside N(3)-acetyltransferase n=1 Tax=Geomonas paludis TaxID=2740185 RepID=A0A6V8MUH5_9BACT|nr:AAC(3) family N-acetyltransferase [Geomonas paludis]GFO63836.1 hypothetical protein GMPD_17550 [Geomonas paludis]
MTLTLLKYRLRSLLPEFLVQRISKKLRKREGARRKKEREALVRRLGTFDANELVETLHRAGVTQGSILFVQSSFNDMPTFRGNPLDILNALRRAVGPEGTLLMPAYTNNIFETPPRDFLVEREPTYTGIVNEMFRRSPGVLRSLHPRHSICGAGPMAEALLGGHERCLRADGPDSPFDRLRLRPDARILTLGLPPGYISFLHWIEDFEPEKLPFRVHDPEPLLCRVVQADGSAVEVADWQVAQEVAPRMDYRGLARNLSPQAMNFFQLRGTSIALYPVDRLSQELAALRDRGIIHYR